MKVRGLKLIGIILFIALVTIIMPNTVNATEGGATIDTARNITLGNQYTKEWTISSERNCFNKIKLESQGILKLELTKPIDSEGNYGSLDISVYDENEDLIGGKSTYYQTQSSTSKYTYYIGLAKGIYYISFTPEFFVVSGKISINYNFSFVPNNSCEIEPNETKEKATKLTLNKTYQGYYGDGYSYYSHLSYHAENDYYKVTLKEGKTYRIVMEDKSQLLDTSIELKLHKTNGEEEVIELKKVDNKNNNYYEFICGKTGDYYIQLSNYKGIQKSYKIGIYDNTPINDIAGGEEISNARNIILGKQYSKSWSKDNYKAKCFNKVEISKNGILKIDVIKPTLNDEDYIAMEIAVFDNKQNKIWEDKSNKDSNSKNYTRYIGLAKGIYYIEIFPSEENYKRDITTNYTISFTANNYCEIEPNEKLLNATELKLNNMYQGYLTDEINAEDDYYKVNLVKGKRYKIIFANYEKIAENTNTYLYTPTGEENNILFEKWILDKNFNRYYEFEAGASGTYYIELKASYDEQFAYKVGVYEETPTSSIKLGDVNKDGKINTKDAREILLAYIGKTKLTAEQKQAADVNKDGKINTKDARQVLLYYIGKIKKF